LALAGDVDPGRAGGRNRIDALVLGEVDIFSGQGGVDGVLRDVLEVDHAALAARGVVDLPQQLAGAVENLSGLEAQRVGIVQHRDGRQVARQSNESYARGDAAEQQQEHRREKTIRNPYPPPSRPRWRAACTEVGGVRNSRHVCPTLKAQSVRRARGLQHRDLEGQCGGDHRGPALRVRGETPRIDVEGVADCLRCNCWEQVVSACS
jgi:hypothetical protein